MGGQGSIPRRSTRAADGIVDPVARFVLELVDGRRDVTSIAEESMLDPSRVTAILEQLASSGLVSYADGGAQREVEPVTHERAHVSASDLALMRLRVEMLVNELEGATHYEALGVPGDADRAAIKKAYFALSKEFHPDGQLGRRVGELRPRVEGIFRKLTEAHDTLTKPKLRLAYDEHLLNARRKPFERRLHPDEEPVLKLEGAKGAPAGQVDPSAPAGGAAARSPDSSPTGTTPSHGTDSGRGGSTLRQASSPGTARPVIASRPMSMPGVPRPTPPVEPNPAQPSSGSSRRPVVSGDPTRADSVSVPRPTPASGNPVPAQGIRVGVTPSPAGRRPSIPPPSMGAEPGRTLVPTPSPAVSVPDATRPAGATPAGASRPAMSRDISQRMAKDLARAVGQPLASPQARAPAAADEKALVRALHATGVHTGPMDGVAKFDRQAARLEADGDLTGAAGCLRVALQIDPARLDIKARLEGLEVRIAASEADQLRVTAKAAEKARNFEAAAKAWQRVCLGVPRDAEARVAAARTLLEGGGDLRIARDHAQRAVELEPQSAEGRITLARVFIKAGMKLNAQRELDAAAKLEPGNEMIKNLLREMK